MGLRHRLAALGRSWFSPRHLDAELDEEMRFHLDQETQQNVKAGMAPVEARRAAVLAVGSTAVITDVSRERRPGQRFRQAVADTRYGLRLLARAPGFAATAAIIIALGVATTTAVFSVLYAVVLRPLPYPESGQLVGIWTRLPSSGFARVPVGAADFADWKASATVFEDAALVRNAANFNLTDGGTPERLPGARMSANLLSVLRVRPALGRAFTPDENEAGHDRVVLLSHALWLRRFGGDPNVLGRTVSLSGVPHTVVGILPATLDYPGPEIQLWVPLTIDPDEFGRSYPAYNYLAVARLKPGVTVADAQRQMNAAAAQLAASAPSSDRDVTFVVLPLFEDVIGPVRPVLYAVFGAAGCLLLIGCLNLANLFGVRAASRGREYAVRLALGASHGRLFAQSLAEAAPLLIIGGSVGILGAWFALRVFATLVPASLPHVEEVHLDLPVLSFALGILVLTGVVASLLPALRAARTPPAAAVRETNRSTAGSVRQSGVSNTLVVAQIALLLPMLVVAGLLVRSFVNVVRISPGFQAAHVLSMQLAIARSTYGSDAQVADVCHRIVERVSALPGVSAVGMVNRLPLGGTTQTLGFVFEGVRETIPLVVDSRTITPDYFAAMDIPMLEGRTFTEHDVDTRPIPRIGASFPTTAIVDERVARDLFPDGSAVGRRFRLPLPEAPWVEIVGVVGHVHHEGLEVDPRPQIYFNYRQRAQDRMALVVRGNGDVRALDGPIRAALHEIDPDQPVYDVRTMEDVLSRSTAQRRLTLILVGIFAASAMILAAVGLYSIVAAGVTQRTREFGVRLAMGGRPADIVRLVVTRGARLAIVGGSIGLALALAVSRGMTAFVFGVSTFDAVTFAGVLAAIVVVTLVATYVPARRASLVDPVKTLRAE
jgi:predicted permease